MKETTMDSTIFRYFQNNSPCWLDGKLQTLPSIFETIYRPFPPNIKYDESIKNLFEFDYLRSGNSFLIFVLLLNVVLCYDFLFFTEYKSGAQKIYTKNMKFLLLYYYYYFFFYKIFISNEHLHQVHLVQVLHTEADVMLMTMFTYMLFIKYDYHVT